MTRASMDDSDQDFSDLCSRLLKRVRRRGGDSGDEKRTAEKSDGIRYLSHSAANAACSNKEAREKKAKTKDVSADPRSDRGVKPQALDDSEPALNGLECAMPKQNDTVEDGLAEKTVKEVMVKEGVKEKVVRRMQQFKRVDPQKLLHAVVNHGTTEPERQAEFPAAAPPQRPLEEPEGDEALAIRLQEELDREAQGQAEARRRAASAGVEEGGLFFCQICQRDLTAMSPQLRAQHINRCLDGSEDSAPSVPRQPRIPECPICGKGFKSQKSRSAHLKRCSADMGVPPAMLLQAVQRQAAESVSDGAANQPQQAGGSKRKDPSDPSCPGRKKSRKKSPAMDEDTQMALALSRSLLEQEKERDREGQREREMDCQLVVSPSHVAAVLQWKPGAGKTRGKRKKGALPAPPPLLLAQDPQAALSRLQERVSSLLLRPRPVSPPTPTMQPSTLPGWTGDAPLWLKTALPGGGPKAISAFYTPELSAFIQPCAEPERETSKSIHPSPAKTTSAALSDAATAGDPDTPTTLSHAQGPRVLPLSAQPSPATLSLGTQALRDVLDLAKEGMTLSQCSGRSSPVKERGPCAADLPLSGFVPEAPEAKTQLKIPVCVSRLTSDLGSMVNNPQLSDVQLQVDSGEVFFSHSFMLYARCPLLAQMVHDGGFGVQEEGMAEAQRVLLGEVPPGAVLALLQYLYTGHCPLTPHLVPHVRELAHRFDLPELAEMAAGPGAAAWEEYPAEESLTGAEKEHQDLGESNFLELLRSMWNQEDSDGQDDFRGCGEVEKESDEGEGRSDGEIREERVNEEELEEIYEFAATQRKMESVAEMGTESEEVDEAGEVEKGGNTCLKTNVEHEETRTKERELCESQNGEVLGGTKAHAGCHSNTKATETSDSTMVTNPKGFGQSEGPSTETLDAGSIPVSCARASLGPDARLEGSYSRLFSQSWGDYVEPSQSLDSSTFSHSQPPLTELSGQQSQQPLQARRQSSVHEIIDLSISPPSLPGQSRLSLPVPGLSPEAAEGEEGNRAINSKDQSPAPHCTQPELIVLSDSGEEMDVEPPASDASSQHVDALSVSPSPPVPESSQSPEKFTRIRAQTSTDTSLSPTKPFQSGKVTNFSDQSSDHLSEETKSKRLGSESARSDVGPNASGADNQSPLDGSAELSWLIPSTPLQSTRTSATQTHSVIRRTQLFPKRSSSSSSSTSTISNSAHTCTSSRSVQTESSSLGGNVAPSRLHNTSQALCEALLPAHSNALDSDAHERSPFFSAGSSHPRRPWLMSERSNCSAVNSPRLRGSAQPTSSTPMQADSSLRLQIPLSSPLFSEGEQKLPGEQGQRGSSSTDGSGKRGLGSLRLTLSGNSSSTSKASRSGMLGSRSSAQRRSPTESRHFQSTQPPEEENENVEDVDTREESEKEMEEEVLKERSLEEVGAAEEDSFCALDEPPMAFDDSWGLAGGVGAQAPCFSLRLESSGEGGSSTGHGVEAWSAAHVSPALPQPVSPQASPPPGGQLSDSLLNSKIWDDWGEKEEEEEDVAALPLSQRVVSVAPAMRVAQLKTPVANRKKGRPPLVPVTPMPCYSDMDTPELKNKLNRFGVRPLPKKQMVLKLKEIHQYTHQLVNSSEEEAGEDSPLPGHPRPFSQPASVSCTRSPGFKQPLAPPAVSPRKQPKHGEEDPELLSASQGSSTSTAASEESDRSNPELCVSDGEDSDGGGVTASQAATREKDKLQAISRFILSDPELYGRVLRYQPLVLAELQARLKAAGIRLGATKLLDFLDSKCITFTTAKPGHAAPPRRRGRGKGTAVERRGGLRGRRKAVSKSHE